MTVAGWTSPLRFGGTRGEKWSRQSEELPLHRVLDLAILIVRTRLYFKERYRLEKDDTETKLDRLPLQGDAMNVAFCGANPFIEEDIKLFDECLRRDDEIIGERLHLLASMLKELEYVRP